MIEKLQVQNKSVFAPAVWLMNHLTYPRKFILIGFLFVLPLGLVHYLLISEINERINFSQKEVVGNRMLKPLRYILMDLQRARGLRVSQKSKELSSLQALQEIQKEIDIHIEKFSEMENKNRALFSVEQRLSLFLKSWKENAAEDLTAAGEPRFKADTQQINVLLELMTDVADRSNLILDPDLDSYYLMTSVVTQLPMLAEQMGQARGWGAAVLFSETILPEDVFYLSHLVGVITHALASSQYSYEVIFRENPTLKTFLSPLLDTSREASDVFLRILNDSIFESSENKVSPETYWQAGTAAIEADFKLYDASASLLTQVLQKRIDRFENKKRAVLVFTLAVLILVSYLVTAFYLAMMNVITMIGLVSKRIVSGQMDDEGFSMDSRDEMGQVVKSFSKLMVRLHSERDQSASLIFNAPIIVCGISSEGITHFVNPAGEKLTGYRSEELVGKNWWTLFYPGAAFLQVEKLFLAFKKGDVRDYEMTLKAKSGEHKIVSWNSIRRFDEDGQLIEVIGFGNDVTEKKRAEHRLAAQYAVTKILAQAPDLNLALKDILSAICQNLNWQQGATWQIDSKRSLLHCSDFWREEGRVSRAFEQESLKTTFGPGAGLPGRIWENLQPLWILDFSKETNFPRQESAMKDGLCSAFGFAVVYGSEFIGVMEFYSTEIRPVDAELLEMGKAIGAQIGQFIYRFRIEAQLLQSQKMETVGTLAGGIAHDLNNQLTPISGYLDLLLKSSGLDLRSRTFLEEANLAAKRCAAMVFGLLNFSRPSGPVKTTFKLEQVLKEYEKLLKTMYPANIRVNINYEHASGIIRGNETEIQTVLMNFAVNARDAMAATGGELALEVVWADFNQESIRTGRQVGRYAVITVSDTGCGMTPEVIRRIYEPFFTTKPKGKGTGLGLAMVFKIINEHQGWVEVSSEPGHGTIFKIHLPEAVDVPPNAHDNKNQNEELEFPHGNGETVLFADDVASIRDLARVLLEKLGYKALFASNSDEVQELYVQHQAEIALVIMDMTMPTIPGRQIMQKILGVNPKARIIVTTGFTDEGAANELLAAGAAGFIAKPYTLRLFADAIHQALSQPK